MMELVNKTQIIIAQFSQLSLRHIAYVLIHQGNFPL